MTDQPEQDARGRTGSRSDDEWVLLSEAASTTGCTESWLMDRCRDGRLPSRPAPGSGRLVPLVTVRALVAGRISE
jgi:hypothetical protein